MTKFHRFRIPVENIKHAFIAMLIFVVSLNSLGQTVTFEKTFSGGGNKYCKGHSIQQTSDGGYIIAGEIADTIGNGSIYLLKTNSAGDSLWTRTFSGLGIAWSASVQQTIDNGYIITGTTIDTNSFYSYVYLIKTDNNGIELWSKFFDDLFGTSSGNSVRQTTDSGYIIAGTTTNTNGDGLYLIKTNTNGDSLWTKSFPDIGSYSDNCIQETNDGGYIVAGSYNGIFMLKTDTNGDSLWSKNYGQSNYYAGTDYSIHQTTDEGYIVVGHLQNGGGVYIIKTDANGDTLWTKTTTYGVTIAEGTSVQQTNDGGYIIAGRSVIGSGSNAPKTDVYLLKLNTNGDELWAKTFGGIGWDAAYSIQQTTDKGYILAGNYNDFTYSTEIYLLKTDSLGCINLPPAPNIQQPSAGILCSSDTGFTYFWFLNGVLQPSFNTQCISITASGTYEVAVQDSAGCNSNKSAGVYILLTANENINTDNFDVQIYPNPTHQTANLVINQFRNQKECYYELYDNAGRMLFKQNVTHGITKIDIANLAQGVYFLVIKSNEEVIYRKFIKE